jgi:release factor glutamine methyltransferase
MPEESQPKSAASLRELLKDVAGRLVTVSESPTLDAEILLGRAIDMPRSYFFSHPEDVPDDAAVERFEKTVARRLGGEPMAYITGSKEFWSLDLMVTPATLVPRPETEILVELALREIPRKAAWKVLDLGTGSGAIAVAVAKERPLCDITATDTSPEALRVAEQNVRSHDLGNVEFLEGDWTEPVQDRQFDLIVSNPPYVEAGDPDLQRLASEPQMALVSGEDGFDAILVLARDCAAILKDGGALIIEHGCDQESGIASILSRQGWLSIECHKDYAGLPRITTARKIARNSTDA